MNGNGESPLTFYRCSLRRRACRQRRPWAKAKFASGTRFVAATVAREIFGIRHGFAVLLLLNRIGYLSAEYMPTAIFLTSCGSDMASSPLRPKPSRLPKGGLGAGCVPLPPAVTTTRWFITQDLWLISVEEVFSFQAAIIHERFHRFFRGRDSMKGNRDSRR